MALVTLTHDLCKENARDLSVFSTDFTDACMDSGFNTVNFGELGYMDVGKGAGKGAASYNVIALYDLSNAIPKSATITAALWYLYIESNSCILDNPYSWAISRCTRRGQYDDSNKNITEDLDTTETVIDVTDETPFHVGEVIRIDNEKMYVTGTLPDQIYVQRGALGTAPATHTNGASIYFRNLWHEGYVSWDNYKQYTPWTVPGGDMSTPSATFDQSVLGYATGAGVWWTRDILALVSDARASRDDILTMIFKRHTDDPGNAGVVRFATKGGTVPYSPHVRITYTLDSRTFQVMIR